MIRLGREATRLQKQRKTIEDANKALQLELDRLTSLDSVEKKATNLGFAPTDPGAIVMVSSRVVTSPEPAATPAAEAPSAPASGAAR